MNRETLANFNSNFFQLRKIINSWDLIPGCPKDEFDSLVMKVLSQLYKKLDRGKIKGILRSEIIVHYGLFSFEFDVETLSDEIINWWDCRTK